MTFGINAIGIYSCRTTRCKNGKIRFKRGKSPTFSIEAKNTAGNAVIFQYPTAISPSNTVIPKELAFFSTASVINLEVRGPALVALA